MSTVRNVDSEFRELDDVIELSFVWPERILEAVERGTPRFNELERDVERECECTFPNGESSEMRLGKMFSFTSSFSSSSQTALIRRFSSTRREPGCEPTVFDRRGRPLLVGGMGVRD